MNQLRIKQTIYLGITAFIVTVAFVGYEWQKFLSQSLLPAGTSIAYDLKPKTSIYQFTDDLRRLNILDTKKQHLLIVLAHLRGDAQRLKVGEYLLEGSSPPARVLDKLVNAEVIQRKITFLEGWSFNEVLKALKANPYLHHTLSEIAAEEIMEQLGYPGISPEGQFFPDTYFFIRGTTDTVILKKAFALMQKRFAKAWQKRDPNITYTTPYQALIAASIIEKESGFKPERPLIASVLFNRWHKSMPLQIDSTVSYGLGGITPLTKTHLAQKTPYNTYLNRGWPPTPIAMPSLDAIQAALHPQQSQFIYFVATGESGHHFSVSLKEHHMAVKRYRAKMKKLHISVIPYLLPELFEKRYLPLADPKNPDKLRVAYAQVRR